MSHSAPLQVSQGYSSYRKTPHGCYWVLTKVLIVTPVDFKSTKFLPKSVKDFNIIQYMGVFIKFKSHIHMEAFDIHVKYEGMWMGMVQFYSAGCQHIPQLEHTRIVPSVPGS